MPSGTPGRSLRVASCTNLTCTPPPPLCLPRAQARRTPHSLACSVYDYCSAARTQQLWRQGPHLLASGEEDYGALLEVRFDEEPEEIELVVKRARDVKLLQPRGRCRLCLGVRGHVLWVHEAQPGEVANTAAARVQ